MRTILTNFIIIHIAITVGYFFLASKKDSCQAFCEAVIVLLLPGVGVAFLIFINTLKLLSEDKQDPAYVYQDFKHRQPTVRRPLKQEADIIPMSEVLKLDDTATKRKILGDVIKRDLLHNREALFDAVQDADSEVSHYAVSVVTHRIAEIESLLFELRQKNRQNPDNPEILRQYAEGLNFYLQLGNLDEVSRVRCEQEYGEVLESLIFLDGKEKRYFIELINCHIKNSNYEQAEYICRVFREKFPLAEEPYLAEIKLNYYLQNYAAISTTINQLKQVNITFTKEALQVVRFWDGGIHDAS